jgi:endonuclease YncB( thermonuclease family)
MRTRTLSTVLGFVLGVVVATAIPPMVTAGRSTMGLPDRSASRPVVVGTYTAELVRVIDGDTFEARVHVWPGVVTTTRVRLRGIDTPELEARCAEERSKAEAARKVLAAILADGEITVLHVGLDKYAGRVVADAATSRTPDVSAAMLARGVARAYSGGRRAGWCD